MAKGMSNKEILASIQAQRDASKELEQSTSNYVKQVAELGRMLKEIEQAKKGIAEADKIIQETTKEINAATQKTKKLEQDKSAEGQKNLKIHKEELKALKDKVAEHKKVKALLQDQIDAQEEQVEGTKETIKEVNKLNLAWNSTNKALNASSKMIRGGIVKGFRMLKGSGLFEMAKEIKKAQLQMGLTTKQTESFRTSIERAGMKTAVLGVDVGQLAKAQANFSSEMGRSIELGEAGLESIALIGEATGLGVDGAASMVAEMDKFNISAVGAKDLIEDTVNSASKMGLNSSKVIKNMQQNLKLAQKYHFKGGMKGLASMAQYATKMGIEMNAMAGFADKVFRPEGAIKAAAELQTMGGAFAQMADPIKMMFKARNDFEGFTKDIGNAAKELVTFTEDGEAQITGLQLDRMRRIAEITGVSEEAISKLALQGAKFDKIKSFLPPMMSEDDQKLISNLAVADGKGGFEIKVGKDIKKVGELNDTMLEQIRREDKSLKERIKSSKLFDDSFGDLVKSLKTLLLPLINQLNDYLAPILQNFTEELGKDGGIGDMLRDVAGSVGKSLGEAIKTLADDMFGPGFIDGMKEFVKTVGGFVKGIAKFVAENPKLSAALLGVLVLGGPIMNLASSIMMFTKGIGSFLGGMKGMMGGLSSAFGGGAGGAGFAGSMGRGAAGLSRGALMRGGAVGAAGALVGGGLSYVRNNYIDDRESGTGKALGVGSAAAYGAGIGGAIGSIIPGVGTAIGAGVGALGGAGYGLYNEFSEHGPQAKGGVQDAAILGGGEIRPIHNKDGVALLTKPGGAVDRASRDSNSANSNSNGRMKVDVGGTIIVKTDTGQKIDVDDKELIRKIALAIGGSNREMGLT